MIIPNGKNKNQVYQGEYKNQNIWNDVFRKLSENKTALAVEPNSVSTNSDNTELDKVMNDSNNVSMRPPDTNNASESDELKRALEQLPAEKIREFLDNAKEVDSAEIKREVQNFLREKGYPVDVLLQDRPGGGWELKIVKQTGPQKITKK